MGLPVACDPVIVWLNGTHGAGKTTTSALVQQLIPDSRVFDAEKVGETLMDITPGLPGTDNFQHWPPWRQLVVETARRVLDYTVGTLAGLHPSGEVWILDVVRARLPPSGVEDLIYRTAQADGYEVEIFIGVFVGAVTFTGSIVERSALMKRLSSASATARAKRL